MKTIFWFFSKKFWFLSLPQYFVHALQLLTCAHLHSTTSFDLSFACISFISTTTLFTRRISFISTTTLFTRRISLSLYIHYYLPPLGANRLCFSRLYLLRKSLFHLLCRARCPEFGVKPCVKGAPVSVSCPD